MAEQFLKVCLRSDNAPAYKQLGKDKLVEFLTIALRTFIAEDKLTYYRLGFLKTQKGDLRTAQSVEGETDEIITWIRLAGTRRHPRVISAIKRHATKMDPSFFERVGRALNQPELRIKHLGWSKLQYFLLRYWIKPSRYDNGVCIPPFCVLSDPAIAKLANKVVNPNHEYAPDVFARSGSGWVCASRILLRSSSTKF
jgi:hypothetical protein